MNEVATLDDAFDSIINAAKAGDAKALMAVSGQADDDTPKQGLSRLNINYETETDDGKSLKRGAWKVFHDGEFVYADSVEFKPLLRTYEWSVWDQEEGKFSCRSVQAPSLNHRFPDTSGGDKCGRLTKSEEEQLGEDHPMTLASRLATCNQVFYANISMDGVNADGDKVEIKDYPVMAYFKRSGFRPAREAIDKLTNEHVSMQEAVFDLTTSRKKQGSVTYYVPVFTRRNDTDALTEEKSELLKTFAQTVKASNINVMEQHKEAVKAQASKEEVDLAAEFGG